MFFSKSKVVPTITPPLISKKKRKSDDTADTYIKQLREKQGYMPFTSHLQELRVRIIRAFVVLGLITLLCFYYYDEIWINVMSTMADIIEKGRKQNITIDLVTTRMQDEFFIQFKVALMVGILLACPYIIFEIWYFISPAVNETYKRWSNYILVFAVVLFWGGVLFSRKFIWPVMAEFLLFAWTPPPLVATSGNLIYTKKYLTIPDYVSSFFNFHFAFGLTFEMPVLCVILSILGVINTKMLITNWRISVMIIAVVSALITPADWLSMLLMMAPLLALYVISICLVFIVERKKYAL